MDYRKRSVSKATVIFFLFIAICSNAIGNVCLSHGMRTIGLVEKLDFVTLGKILSRAVALPTILCGVAMLTVFFGLFLLLLSWADLSYVLPLLSVSYVVNVILARAVLHEIVPVTRWLGVLTICFGVYYMSSTWNGEIQQRDSAEATD